MGQKNFTIIILAAGKGKRMGGDLPKVLRTVKNRPIISCLVDSVKKSGLVKKPMVVVCNEHNLVQETLGESCDYVVQSQQLGTGHAVASARSHFENQTKKIIVLYGDMPLIAPETVAKLATFKEADLSVLTLFTTEVKDFEDWRKSFYNFGRIIRNAAGEVIAIREKKDCSPQEIEIKEVNPGLYIFDARWLCRNLGKLDNKNAQGEYYLTDLVKLAMEQGHKINSIKIDAKECVGINTPEELALAESLICV